MPHDPHTPKTRVHDFLRPLADLPGIRHLRKARYARRVGRTRNWTFWGVFESYEEARAAAPLGFEQAVGYETPGMATLGGDDYRTMHPFDYPALFWLVRFLTEPSPASVRRVVDLGGHLGEKFTVYRRYWTFPTDLEWLVLETEDAVREAEGLPEEHRPPGLAFSTDRTTLSDADLCFASGSLQYLDRSLGEILVEVGAAPRHLVINKVPLSETDDLWTLQNVGAAMAPYHIMRRNLFLEPLRRLGYRVVDEWTVPSRSARIPFHPGVGTERNRGMALVRETGTDA